MVRSGRREKKKDKCRPSVRQTVEELRFLAGNRFRGSGRLTGLMDGRLCLDQRHVCMYSQVLAVLDADEAQRRNRDSLGEGDWVEQGRQGLF